MKVLCIRCGDINGFPKRLLWNECKECWFLYTDEGKEKYSVDNIMKQDGKEYKEMQIYISKQK